MRRRRASGTAAQAALLLVGALTLTTATACGAPDGSNGSAPTTEPSPTGGSSSAAPGIPMASPVLPLPAGASILAPTGTPSQLDETCDALPTLAPVDQPPERLVPEIRKRGRLVVGTDQGSNLFSFRDPVTGALKGFDVDLAREITRDVFGNPDQVEFRTLTPADRVPALAGRQVDLVVRSMTISCARRDQVRFSAPYYQAHQRVLAVRGSGITGIGDLEGRRVCVAAGTTSAARLQAMVRRVTVLGVNSWADCLVAIQQGQIDAITSDDAILAGITAQDPYLEIVGPDLGSEPYGVGIATSTIGHDTDGLTRQVNRTLQRIGRDGTWDRMYSTWLSGLGPDPGIPRAVYQPEPPAPEAGR